MRPYFACLVHITVVSALPLDFSTSDSRAETPGGISQPKTVSTRGAMASGVRPRSQRNATSSSQGIATLPSVEIASKPGNKSRATGTDSLQNVVSSHGDGEGTDGAKAGLQGKIVGGIVIGCIIGAVNLALFVRFVYKWSIRRSKGLWYQHSAKKVLRSVMEADPDHTKLAIRRLKQHGKRYSAKDLSDIVYASFYTFNVEIISFLLHREAIMPQDIKVFTLRNLSRRAAGLCDDQTVKFRDKILLEEGTAPASGLVHDMIDGSSLKLELGLFTQRGDYLKEVTYSLSSGDALAPRNSTQRENSLFVDHDFTDMFNRSIISEYENVVDDCTCQESDRGGISVATKESIASDGTNLCSFYHLCRTFHRLKQMSPHCNDIQALYYLAIAREFHTSLKRVDWQQSQKNLGHQLWLLMASGFSPARLLRVWFPHQENVFVELGIAIPVWIKLMTCCEMTCLATCLNSIDPECIQDKEELSKMLHLSLPWTCRHKYQAIKRLLYEPTAACDTLQDTARRIIRLNLNGSNIYTSIRKLPAIPNKLKDLIILNDIYPMFGWWREQSPIRHVVCVTSFRQDSDVQCSLCVSCVR